jgi:Ca-activated chloride channel family protein
MKRNKLKSLVLVGCLLTITCAALVYAGKGGSFHLWSPPVISGKNGILTLSGNLTQNKVLYGGDGTAVLALTLSADEILDLDRGEANHVDMVIVLDRSGSMDGKKISDAKTAVLNLLSNLTSVDRFGLVTYSDGVQRRSNLLKVTPVNRKRLESIIRSISAGGATNLGAGLQEGIDLLLSARRMGNVRRVILISDGLANRGITDPVSLGNMATVSMENEFAVSTVGVGSDFNEQLMTYIADRGAGNYYYLEDANLFAEVFLKEFKITRAAVATSLEVRLPLRDGLTVVDASGYPIQVKNSQAVIQPGNLLSGQSKKLFLTLRVPTHREQTFEISGISARYRYEGNPYEVSLVEAFQLACVQDQQQVYSSIDKEQWEEKVLNDDFNKLREEVAAEIKDGKQEKALKRIDEYYREQQSVNAVVASPKVATSLERDLEELRGVVNETFQGEPQEVELKQKKNAKSLQYEGYRGRRSKNQ